MYIRFMDDVIFAHKPRLLDVAAQLKCSAHAAWDLAINVRSCSIPVASQRMHGNSFRALKVTFQVTTPGAESAVHDCLVWCALLMRTCDAVVFSTWRLRQRPERQGTSRSPPARYQSHWSLTSVSVAAFIADVVPAPQEHPQVSWCFTVVVIGQ